MPAKTSRWLSRETSLPQAPASQEHHLLGLSFPFGDLVADAFPASMSPAGGVTVFLGAHQRLFLASMDPLPPYFCPLEVLSSLCTTLTHADGSLPPCAPPQRQEHRPWEEERSSEGELAGSVRADASRREKLRLKATSLGGRKIVPRQKLP